MARRRSAKEGREYFQRWEHKQQYMKEYRAKNKERIKEFQKMYYQEHREDRIQTSQKYATEHKAHIKEYQAQYRKKQQSNKRFIRRMKILMAIKQLEDQPLRKVIHEEPTTIITEKQIRSNKNYR
jgi:hypothetical protein